MKCPYCNKILKTIKFNDTFTCLNPNCKQSLGMIGTKLMWEKVASLAKIRNAGKKYATKPDIQEKRREYMAQKYANDPEFKEKRDEYVRKYRAANKDKAAKWAKKYRETHREHYNEYMRNYRKKHFANASKTIEQKD